MTDAVQVLKAALAKRYRIERQIGSGGMATVYLAEDLKHHRRVAIKVLKPELATALGPERFLREIDIAAKLSHPHILPLHDSGEAGGFLFYVMPYVDGESLRRRLNRENQLPLDDALQITREVADAVGYAHSLGIVHRDIKPENILLAARHALVTDFGIARALDAAGREKLTATGIAVGTPAYMSPEQAAGREQVDTRSDIYSLGCILYEMLAGDPPFPGSNSQAILARKLVEGPPALRTVRRTVPIPLEQAVTKALSTAPADRFQTASRFAEALRTGEGTGQIGETFPRATWQGIRARWRRLPASARPRIVATAGLAAAFVMLAAVYRIATGDPIEKFHALKGSRVIIDFPTTPLKQFSETFNLKWEEGDVIHRRGAAYVLPNPAGARVTLPNAWIEVRERPLMVDVEYDVARGRAIVILPRLPAEAGSDSLGRFDFEVVGLSISTQVPVITRRYGDSLIVRLLSRRASTQAADTTSSR